MNTARRILVSFVRRHVRMMVLVLFLSVIVNGLNLVFPWALKIIIDDIVPHRALGTLNGLLILLLVVFVLRFALDFLKEYLTASCVERAIAGLREQLYMHVQHLSLRSLDRRTTGEIISRIMSDTDALKRFLLMAMSDFLFSAVTVTSILAIAVVLNVKLAVITVLCFPFFIVVYLRFLPQFKACHKDIRTGVAGLSGCIGEVMHGIRVVKGYVLHDYEQRRFRQKQEQLLSSSIQAHALNAALWLFSDGMTSVGLALLLYVGAREIMSGHLTSGSVVAFFSYAGMLFAPVVRMVGLHTYYQEAAVSFERIADVLGEESEVREPAHPIRLTTVRGEVTFEQVSFSYIGVTPVLRAINFSVGCGETVALVGASGAGKTTILNLLLRFYDPCQGVITIDGHDIKTLELASYRQHIAMVLQDDYLFSGTIRDNIAYGNPWVSAPALEAASRCANAHGFITRLPHGYDTEIGEGGIMLSGGQRQRIAIARAFLREPRILILDEATAFLDAESEQLVKDALVTLMRGRTTFVIAHRLSTVMCASTIMVLEGGTIVARGRHHELMHTSSLYRSLFERQCVAVS